MRKKLVILLFLVVVVIAGCVYYWYSGIVNSEQKAKAVLSEVQTLREQSNRYKELLDAVSAEKNRCQVFITQKEGDFGSFEYCMKFIQWSNNLPLE
ncbi:MAG: hypothetical protein ABH816_03190 [Candidatus Levyibacteriota bacterium]